MIQEIWIGVSSVFLSKNREKWKIFKFCKFLDHSKSLNVLSLCSIHNFMLYTILKQRMYFMNQHLGFFVNHSGKKLPLYAHKLSINAQTNSKNHYLPFLSFPLQFSISIPIALKVFSWVFNLRTIAITSYRVEKKDRRRDNII